MEYRLKRSVGCDADIDLIEPFVQFPVSVIEIGIDANGQNGDEQGPKEPVPKGAEPNQGARTVYRGAASVFERSGHDHKNLWRQRSNRREKKP